LFRPKDPTPCSPVRGTSDLAQKQALRNPWATTPNQDGSETRYAQTVFAEREDSGPRPSHAQRKLLQGTRKKKPAIDARLDGRALSVTRLRNVGWREHRFHTRSRERYPRHCPTQSYLIRGAHERFSQSASRFFYSSMEARRSIQDFTKSLRRTTGKSGIFRKSTSFVMKLLHPSCRAVAA